MRDMPAAAIRTAPPRAASPGAAPLSDGPRAAVTAISAAMSTDRPIRATCADGPALPSAIADCVRSAMPAPASASPAPMAMKSFAPAPIPEAAFETFPVALAAVSAPLPSPPKKEAMPPPTFRSLPKIDTTGPAAMAMPANFRAISFCSGVKLSTNFPNFCTIPVSLSTTGVRSGRRFSPMATPRFLTEFVSIWTLCVGSFALISSTA